MLKYENLIKRLSEIQKIRILADVTKLCDEAYAHLGLPRIRAAEFSSYCDGMPLPTALSRSWDTELISKCAEIVFSRMINDGINLAVLDTAKIKFDPYSPFVSEDPYLCSQITARYLSAAQKVGIPVCLKGYGITHGDMLLMDRKADMSVIREYLVKPFSDVAGEIGFTALMFDGASFSKEYDGLDFELAKDSQKDTGVKFCICKRASASNTVKYLQNGIICFEGSDIAIESAVRRHAQIKKAFESGSVQESDLVAEIENGRAISPEAVDAALDRLFELADVCQSVNPFQSVSEEDTDGAIKDACLSCAVLLKNAGGLLPLSKKLSAVAIGACLGEQISSGVSLETHIETALAIHNIKLVGCAEGYRLGEDRNEELIARAKDLAASADVCLLFMDTDKERGALIPRTRNLCLQADQAALLSALKKTKAKVVAVLFSDHSVDITELEGADAVLLMPASLKYGAQTAVSLVLGECAPCGSLSYTLYRDSERSLKKQERSLDGGMKAGRFIGYRYYDTADYDVGFPFGHGLAYSEFSYSQAKMLGNRLSFTVKNTGKYTQRKTLQIYIGIRDSQLIRPKKELAAFKTVELAPKAVRRVEIQLDCPRVWDEDSKRFVCEKGRYEIFVCESVSDVRLTLSEEWGEVYPGRQDERIERYLHSESNILSENYVLEAKYKRMKRSGLNIVCGIALLVLAVALLVFCNIKGLNHTFLNIIAGAMIVVSAVFFLLDINERRKIDKAEAELADKANRENFSDAENLAEFSTAEMFKEEFDAVNTEEEEYKKENDESDSEYYQNINKELDFDKAAEQLETFAAEHGMKLHNNSAKKIFAALASSRLVLIRGMEEDSFKSLTVLLAEYFDSSACLDVADRNYVNEQRLLFKTDTSGNRVKTGFASAIISAKTNKSKIHIAALTNVGGSALEGCFASLAKHAKNPSSAVYIKAVNEDNDNAKYYLPKNLWVFVNLDSYTELARIPASLSEVSVLLEVGVSSCDKSYGESTKDSFGYYQLEYLAERAHAKFEIDEESWKKLDNFIALVDKEKQFCVGNKQWLGIERYASAFLACGGDRNEVMDNAVAARIIVSALGALSDCEDTKDVCEMLESAFGENNTDVSCRIVKEDRRLGY